MAATGSRARSIVRFSPELACNVRRMIGFQAYCACGWEGHLLKRSADAVGEKRLHADTCPREWRPAS